MSDNPLHKLEALLGAISNVTAGRDEEGTLTGVRCPRCDWTGFAKVEAVYDAAVARTYNEASDPSAKHEGGLTDDQIVRRLAPPQRQSPLGGTLVLAVLLVAAAVYVYRRFGDVSGEIAAIFAVIVTVMFLLTRARKLSEAYYIGRARWRKLYMCRNCGQLVQP